MKFSRRSFLSNSCKTCGALVLAGSVITTAESCSSIAVFKTSSKNQTVQIPLTEMININKKIIRVANLEYDILLVKKNESVYKALILKCTHEDWLLSAGEKSINCTAHGSTFDFEGNVTEGPASLPLALLPLVIHTNNIQITIPI